LGLIALLAFPILSAAQTSFFEVQTVSQAQLSSSAMLRYVNLQDTNYSKDVKIVAVGDVRTLQQDGVLKFLFPGSLDTVVAVATQIEDNDRVGFTWNGQLLNELGYVSFNYKDGITSGFMFKGMDYYDLIPADSTKQFLVQRSQKGAGCGVPPTINTLPDITTDPGDLCEPNNYYNTCPAVISVLVIVTPEAESLVQATYGDLGAYIRNKESQVNMAFQNSDIPNKSIRVEYIVKANPPLLDGDVDLDEVQAWSLVERETFSADLVVLLCDQYLPTAAGIAQAPFIPDPDQAFAIVEVKRGDGVGSFPHEIGHLFGCRHNWTVDWWGNDNTLICAHGYRHILSAALPGAQEGIAQDYRTLVTVPGPANKFYRTIDGIKYEVTETWTPHYSNPDVYYQFLNGSIRTGRPNIHITDNAEQIRRNGCAMSAYRPGQELAVFPIFSPAGCQMGNPITFTALIVEPDEDTRGKGPYTFTWRWNKTGIFHSSGNNSTPLGTGSPLTITEHPACPTYWVQCKVVSADQVTITKVFRVVRGPICNCYGPPPGDGDDRSLSGTSSEMTRLYPNPVEAGSFVQVPAQSFWFELTDPKGVVAASGTFGSEASFQVPDALAAGLYFVRLRMADGTSQVHKLFTLKSH